MAKSAEVVQTEGEEVPTEILAAEIIAISAGIKKLRAGRLNDHALFLLVAKAAPMFGPRHRKEHVTLNHVKAVLAGIEGLEKAYLKPKKA